MPIIKSEITGYRHLDDHEQRRYKGLGKGMRLELVREPDNRHDSNAVLVTQDRVKVGYIPMRDNQEIAQAMDAGAQPRCVCTNWAVIDGIRVVAQAKIEVEW